MVVDDCSSLMPDFFFESDFFVVDECMLPLVLAVLPVLVVDVSVLFAHEVRNATPIRSAMVEMRDRFMVMDWVRLTSRRLSTLSERCKNFLRLRCSPVAVFKKVRLRLAELRAAVERFGRFVANGSETSISVRRRGDA